ncbi:DUF1471 domain-containing protein, partial [Escherichia coli]|nr:DUF1471 domain-containing protein [Escherichia coli]
GHRALSEHKTLSVSWSHYRTLTGHAFAATEIHKPDNNLEQLSKVSMSTHNSNPAGVESQIKEKAEELQASNYYISSFSGKNYIHATVIFYK